MTIDEAKIKIGELACYARTKGWDDEYTEAVNKVEECIKELQAYKEAWIVVANAMKECSYKIWYEFGEYVNEDCEQLEIINLKTALDILEDYRPKEGDAE